MRRIFLFIVMLTVISSCEGLYQASGNVKQLVGNKELAADSVTVLIYVGKKWKRDSTVTTANGNFGSGGLTHPWKKTYYFVFSKTNYKTDTVSRRGQRGQSLFYIDHTLTKLEIP